MCRRITHLSIDDCVNAHQCVLLIGTIRLQAVLSRRSAIEHRVAACKINISAASVWGLDNKRRSKDKLFFLSTFKDVLAEVKHAFLDSVSLLRDLHVFIHLIKDTSCIRSLCTKIHNPTHRLISFLEKELWGCYHLWQRDYEVQFVGQDHTGQQDHKHHICSVFKVSELHLERKGKK